MKTREARPSAPAEVAPDEKVSEGTRYFNAVHLRLLMKEREEVVNRLVELDYAIWNLEEFFRAGSPR